MLSFLSQKSVHLTDIMTMGELLISAMNYAPELTGCGKYTGELAEEIVKSGHEVQVVTTPPHYPGWVMQMPYRNRYFHEIQSGVSIHRCPVLIRLQMSGIWRAIAPISFAMTSAPVMIWQVLRQRPDTILSVEPTLFAAPCVLLASRLVGARSVLHVQDLEVDAAFATGHLKKLPFLMWFGRKFEQFCMSRFDAIVTISQKMAEQIIAKGIPAERISVVRNWVDLKHIRPMPKQIAYRAELGIPENAFVVLYSGNIGAKQALHVIIDVAKQLLDHPDILFVFAGEGPTKTELLASAADLSNVLFVGFQPYDRFSEFLAVADVHILTQMRDTDDLVLPSKIAGMLASGRPIVVTSKPLSEIGTFLGSVAMIVPPGDRQALIDGILKVRAKPDPMIEERSRALAETLAKPAAMTALQNILWGSVAV